MYIHIHICIYIAAWRVAAQTQAIDAVLHPCSSAERSPIHREVVLMLTPIYRNTCMYIYI